ncbi:MAG: hypothetical protein HYV32_05330 [Candidatus Kerfeldbacteria bacterium]|nr:hypothetical protein [Candidatus Kerfeldbacteria bacterium]
MMTCGSERTMRLTPQDIDRLKCLLIGYAFAIPVPQDVEAADQIIRTQVHPTVYDTIRHLNDLLYDGGTDFIRRVAERMGYASITKVFPQAAHVMNAYQHEQDDATMLAHAFRELACLAAFFHQDILDQLFTAVYATQVNRSLQQYSHQLSQQGISHERFVWEHQNMRQRAQRERIVDRTPQILTDIAPVHVAVQADRQVVDYTIPAHFRLFDAVHRCYDVDIHEPVPRERFHLDQHLTIPWARLHNGFLLETVLTDWRGMEHAPERIQFTPHDLRALRFRGSAVSADIGRRAEIRVYPEYFPNLFPGEPESLPQSPLATIRATQAGIELRKLHLPARLTVLV